MRRHLSGFVWMVWACFAATPVVAAGIDYQALEEAIAGGRLVQAKAMLAATQASTDNVDPVRLQAITASLALAEGRNEMAAALFTSLLADAPQSCAFARGAGLAALRLADWQRASTLLAGAATACPPSAQALSWLGVAYARQERWPESDAAFRDALAIAPDDPAILNNAGYSMLRQKRYAEATVLLARGVTLAPGNLRLANNLDIALASEGRFAGRDVASADRQMRADRLNNAGYASWRAGRFETARAYLSEALLASDIYSPRIAANLALVEAELGDR